MLKFFRKLAIRLLGLKRPEVGIAVIIVKDGKVLLGIRKGSHAAGKRAFPGGHLDFGETWANCALRETAEECGKDFKIHVRHGNLIITNDVMPADDKHYITIFMVADWISGDPVNVEPKKNERWDWVTLDEILSYPSETMAGWIPLVAMLGQRGKLGI